LLRTRRFLYYLYRYSGTAFMSLSAPQILVIYAHPAPHRSRVNRRLAEAAAALPNVVLQDLYETYPDFHIDVEREQLLLAAADLVIFQYPIHWYSMPSLMKEWIDAVLEHDWAHGPAGDALEGKVNWLVITTGGDPASYSEAGQHHHSFSAFLPAFEQTARLCGMHWMTPLVMHGAHQATAAQVDAHIENYCARLAAFPDWPELKP
jgi:putative NADPH-quinone reductase